MTTSRAGYGNISSAAGHAQARLTFWAFEIFMLSVGKTRKECEKRFVVFLEPIESAKKFLVFDTAVIVIARKGADKPYCKQCKLNGRKHQIEQAVAKKGKHTAKQCGNHNRYI